MSDYSELSRLADAIHASGSTVQMLARWRAFENACHPKLIKELIAERDQLKAENEALRKYGEEFAVLAERRREEVEALRKDADKWQIVERAMTQLQSDEQGAAIWSACSRILISVACELNSGRSVVTEEGVTNGGVEIGDWRVTVERIDAAMGKGEQP